MNIRPILYNSMIISRKYEVLRNVEIEKYYEIYDLKNDLSLILFKDLSVFMLEKYFKLRILNTGTKKYYYTLISKKENIQKYKRKILNVIKPRGFDAVVGMKDVKTIFNNDIIQPLRNKEKYQRFDVSLPNAILLFGPPGCGKTYFVEKLAEELGFYFINTSQSDFGSTYIHGTSLKIREVFDEAKKKSPSILFIDEIDSLFPKRDNIGSSSLHKQEEINEFLVQMNNIGQDNVILIAATNRPSLLDEAILRTGRVDKLLYIGLPDFQTRKNLFQYYLRNRPLNNIDYSSLAKVTDGYNNSDINYICNEAAKHAIINNLNYIETKIILEVIENNKPSISKNDLKSYEQFMISERK